MAAQEYYQGHPLNPASYAPSEPPPPYEPPNPAVPPQNLTDYKPPYPPQQSSPYQGSPYPQALPYPPPQQQQNRPPHLPSVETHPHSQTPKPYQRPDYLRHTRSYSEPPSPLEHHHHHHHHSHSHSRDSRSRSRGHYAGRSREKPDHDTRNTFLGALGGGVIGDLIAPGLGTLGGALLGGLSGHRAAERSRSGSRMRDGGMERSGRRRDRYDDEWEEGRRRRGEI